MSMVRMREVSWKEWKQRGKHLLPQEQAVAGVLATDPE